MKLPSPQQTVAALVCILGCLAGNTSSAADLFDETKTTTLFAFDQVSIPHSQNLRLEMRVPAKHPANPVLARGEPGTPDAMGVQFYGSIIREGGKYRLWYVAFDDDAANKVASSRWRAAYAESEDGLKWTKPNLGLVKYGGNKNNNLILTDPAPLGFINVKVLADPDDPNPERRYKISAHAYFRHNTRLGTLAPFASADGLSWKLLAPAQPVKAELPEKDRAARRALRALRRTLSMGRHVLHLRPERDECGASVPWPRYAHLSLAQFRALVADQQRQLRAERAAHPARSGPQPGGRAMPRRHQRVEPPQHPARPGGPVARREGMEGHHDRPRVRREQRRAELPRARRRAGLLPRGEDGAWDQGGVIQGQGFENIGDQTFIYYGAWDPRHVGAPRGGVGIATLPRDRFGDLVVEEVGRGPGDYQLPIITSEFITTAVPTPAGTPRRFYVNADGLGPDAALKIELLDEKEQPLPAYSGANAAIVRENGFQTPIAWNGKTEARDLPDRTHIRVVFEGKSNTSIRFSALYVQ